MCKPMNLNSYFIPCSKVNSKQVMDLNVRVKTIILPEENSKNICGLALGINFSDRIEKS